MAIQEGIQWIIIQSDFQLVVNSINEKIEVPNINLMEDVKCLLARFSESRIENCRRVINKDADVLTKETLL